MDKDIRTDEYFGSLNELETVSVKKDSDFGISDVDKSGADNTELEALDTAPDSSSTDCIEEIGADDIESDIQEIVISPEDEKVNNIVKLSKKYKYEGKIIEELDLTGIEKISGEDMVGIEKLYRKITKTPSSSPELTIDYAMAAGSILTGLPVEFFKHISSKDVVKIRNRIINFLYED